MAGPLLLLGVLHQTSALLLLAVIVGALATVQLPAGVSAGLERDLLILVALSLLAVAGPGRFGLRRDRAPVERAEA